MKLTTQTAPDARQTPQWGNYLESIGWISKRCDGVQLFIRKIPFLPASFIKIQHPKGPLPFARIDAIAQTYKALSVIVEPHTAGYSEESFHAHGYQISKTLFTHSATVKISLCGTEESLFASFSANARRNIKKAQNMGLALKPVRMDNPGNWKYFDLFYELLTNLATMKKFYVPSYDEYHKKMSAFKNTSILLFAYEHNVPVAVVWYAYFDGVLAYFQTGITQRGYDTLANYLLVWEGLRLGKRLGLEVFDFESIYDERYPRYVRQYKRYTEFKKRFHGDIIYYPPPWVKWYSLWGKLLYFAG